MLDELLNPGNDDQDSATAAEATTAGCIGTLVGCFRYDVPPKLLHADLLGSSKGGLTGSRFADAVGIPKTTGVNAGIGRPRRLVMNWTDAMGQQ